MTYLMFMQALTFFKNMVILQGFLKNVKRQFWMYNIEVSLYVYLSL